MKPTVAPSTLPCREFLGPTGWCLTPATDASYCEFHAAARRRAGVLL